MRRYKHKHWEIHNDSLRHLKKKPKSFNKTQCKEILSTIIDNDNKRYSSVFTDSWIKARKRGLMKIILKEFEKYNISLHFYNRAGNLTLALYLENMNAAYHKRKSMHICHCGFEITKEKRHDDKYNSLKHGATILIEGLSEFQ
jgi:hypothetical protein